MIIVILLYYHLFGVSCNMKDFLLQLIWTTPEKKITKGFHGIKVPKSLKERSALIVSKCMKVLPGKY